MSVRSYESGPAAAGDRGRDFGAVHRVEVGRTVAAYRAILVDPQQNPLDLREWGSRAFERIAGFAPELAEEIDGIATGAGLSVHDVAAINARTELLALGGGSRGECSVVVALPPGRDAVAVQTWDWYRALGDNWLRWTIRHPGGRVVRTVTEYGIVGKIGVNNSEIGLLFNILHHERDGAGLGVPVHVLARHVLDHAYDLNTALLALVGAQVSASTAITLVDRGSAVSVELSPAGPGVVLPTRDGILVHTNHFLAERGRLGCRESQVGPDTYLRMDVLRRALHGPVAELRADDVRTAMTSHLGGGGAVCCHPDPALPPELQYATLATIELDLAATELVVHPGGPCGSLL